MKNTLSIILIYFTQILYAECSDLTQSDCEYWSAYCQWDSDANVCEEVGGGGGGNTNYGPYEVANYSQEDGMQLGTQYADVTIYYPEEYNGLLGSIILGAGWSGDQGSMADWAYYFSSYGFVSATIQYNDPDNDSHGYRAEAILELISSIKIENDRTSSQLYNSLDTNEFAVVGYSLSGGSVQLAAVLDSTLSAVIALNPTIIVEDCDVCAGSNYCICLVPELLEHEVPTLIIAGQNEVDELPSYDGLLGQDQYYNTPGTTTKMLYEIANGSHGSASFPSATGGQPAKLALHWLNYFIQNKEEYCDSLLVTPENASQFVTTLECGQGIIHIGSGTSFGECIGYCLSDLVINEEHISYNLYGWDQNDSIHRPIEIEESIQIENWQNLITSLDIDAFMNLENTIGCPDCGDGGTEWFEIMINEMVKRVTIDYGSSIAGFENFLESIREIRQGFQDIQSCYFTPNTGECDAASQRYYFDEQQQECMSFTWGGCGGLVPFETFEECEASCSSGGGQGVSSATGYLRSNEISFCMDDCGMYFLESEDGQYITNVANQNNIPYFEYYINRFVEIEGDTVQCVECSALNVSSIYISSECEQPLNCFVDPCTVSNCTSSDSAGCISNYCGDCYADYYEDNELIFCDSPASITDLTGLDFGDCEMLLGFGWVNNHCEAISGCGYIVNDINYSEDIYSSLFECISASTLSIDKLFPLSFNLDQNHPNPFNPKTTINYQLAKSTNVRIIVHDMLGRLVKTLVDEYQSPGYRMVSWNGKNNQNENVSSGIYFYSIQAGNFSLTKKMVLLD